MRVVFLFIISAIISGIITTDSYALTISDRLKKGEVIVEDYVEKGSKSGSVKMTFLVDTTPEKMWKLLVEYDKWTAFMPDLDKVIIKENKPDYAIVYVKAKAPLNIDISYILKRLYNKKNYEITWTLVEGRAKEITGSWKIYPVSASVCKVVYTNYLDLGFMVPPKLVAMLTKSKLPNVAYGIRNYLKNNK
jgi:ribosome-associated toxin RatA of RatAB toxin-antitoxin module